MKFILAFVVLTLTTLVTEKPRSDEKGLFRVVKIQSIHDYYIIYASKDNLKYKIVSKKQSRDGCAKIQKKSKIKKNHKMSKITKIYKKIQILSTFT